MNSATITANTQGNGMRKKRAWSYARVRSVRNALATDYSDGGNQWEDTRNGDLTRMN